MQEATIENKLTITLNIISYIEQLLSKLHGQYLLHCGHELVPLVKKHTPYQFQCASALSMPSRNNSLPDIYGDYTCLPLKTESIDIVLTPYLTEYEIHSQQIMQELFRILKPNGYLCIVGIQFYPTQSDSFFKTLYSNIYRLSYASVLTQRIKQVGGVVIEKKHFFEWPQFKQIGWKGLIRDCLQMLRWIIPSQQHAFLIIAQKKDNLIQPIDSKSPLPLLNTVEICHAKR